MTHLSSVIADLEVEVLAFHTQEFLPRQQDATLGCYGAGRVDVVAGDHAHGDASTLTLCDGIGYLEERERRFMSVSSKKHSR